MWSFFVVFPAASAFFWLNYLAVLPYASRRILPLRHASFSPMNEMCWRQNINSALHTSFAAVCMTAVLVLDTDLRSDRLSAHRNWLLYIELSLSLGYFSFALPMAAYMTYGLKAGFPYGSPIMSLHHVLVVAAQLTYLLTEAPAFYMAAAGSLFELTNVFFIPHVLMIQLGVTGPCPLTPSLTGRRDFDSLVCKPSPTD